MFRGQTTDHVAQIVDSLNIKVVKVPANMTHFFQPLDLTVDGSAKNFMRKKFVSWHAEEIKKQMDAEIPAESIDVNLKLTSLKALHANWLIELYNVLMAADGRETVLNGWKKSGVTTVLCISQFQLLTSPRATPGDLHILFAQPPGVLPTNLCPVTGFRRDQFFQK